jgi:hypothetical protein
MQADASGCKGFPGYRGFCRVRQFLGSWPFGAHIAETTQVCLREVRQIGRQVSEVLRELRIVSLFRPFGLSI